MKGTYSYQIACLLSPGNIFDQLYLLFRFGFNFAERSFHMNEVSAALTGLSHRWIIKAFLPLGMALLFLGALAVLLRNLVFLFGTPEESAEAKEMCPELSSEGAKPPGVESAQ